VPNTAAGDSDVTDDVTDDDEELDLTTPVTYSIKFYYTSAFAAITPDIQGFVSQVVTEVNLGYIHSQVNPHG
jgi:hypothetical protein